MPPVPLNSLCSAQFGRSGCKFSLAVLAVSSSGAAGSRRNEPVQHFLHHQVCSRQVRLKGLTFRLGCELFRSCCVGEWLLVILWKSWLRAGRRYLFCASAFRRHALHHRRRRRRNSHEPAHHLLHDPVCGRLVTPLLLTEILLKDGTATFLQHHPACTGHLEARMLADDFHDQDVAAGFQVSKTFGVPGFGRADFDIP